MVKRISSFFPTNFSYKTTHALNPFFNFLKNIGIPSLKTHHKMFHSSKAPLDSTSPPYFQLVQTAAEFKKIPPLASILNQEMEEELKKTMWDELSTPTEGVHELAPYRRAIGQIVERTLGKYTSHTDSILEIGSGLFPIIEYLPKRESKNLVQLSDVSEKSVNFLKTRYLDAPVKQLDIFSPHVTSPTYHCVVMSDVLNTFQDHEFNRALKNIHNILKAGGHFIHFSIRESFFLYTLDEYKDDNLVYLPLVDKNNLWCGIYLVNLTDFLSFIQGLAPAFRDLQEFLLEYSSLSPAGRDALCFSRMQEESGSLAPFKSLSEDLEKLNCPAKKILFEAHFQERLKRSLNKSKFRIIESQEHKNTYVGPRCPDSHESASKTNLYSINRINRRMEHIDGGLAPNHVREDAVIHVVVAQKLL